MKRVCAGCYEHTHSDGTLFRVVFNDELNAWQWHSASGQEYSNPMPTKKEATEDLTEYLAGRVWAKEYGWHYAPPE